MIKFKELRHIFGVFISYLCFFKYLLFAFEIQFIYIWTEMNVFLIRMAFHLQLLLTFQVRHLISRWHLLPCLPYLPCQAYPCPSLDSSIMPSSWARIISFAYVRPPMGPHISYAQIEQLWITLRSSYDFYIPSHVL